VSFVTTERDGHGSKLVRLLKLIFCSITA
jgi:hypothetical protein